MFMRTDTGKFFTPILMHTQNEDDFDSQDDLLAHDLTHQTSSLFPFSLSDALAVCSQIRIMASIDEEIE
jgi:hypothetical protein